MSRVGESASGLEEDVLDCRIFVLRRGGRGQFPANGSQLRDSNATLMHEAFNAYPAIGQDCKYICLHFGSHDLNLEIRDEASASEKQTSP